MWFGPLALPLFSSAWPWLGWCLAESGAMEMAIPKVFGHGFLWPVVGGFCFYAIWWVMELPGWCADVWFWPLRAGLFESVLKSSEPLLQVFHWFGIIGA